MMTDEEEKDKVEKELASGMFNVLLKAGYDVESPDFKGTPLRFAKVLTDFNTKYKEEPVFTTFPHNPSIVTLVEVIDIDVRSLCAHHLFPFFGVAKITYVPSERKAGLSKFQRVIDYLASIPQDQEALTQKVLTYLVDKLNPIYLKVEIECLHTCMIARGSKSSQARTKTIASYGTLPDGVASKDISINPDKWR